MVKSWLFSINQHKHHNTFFVSLSRWVHMLEGFSRYATLSGLDMAASWTKCQMTVI